MEATEIIRLIGGCIAMIVGTICFMVLFFRGMSWIDAWVKGGSALKQGAERGRRSKTKQSNRTVSNRTVSNRTVSKKRALRNREQVAAAMEVRKMPSNAKAAIQLRNKLLSVAGGEQTNNGSSNRPFPKVATKLLATPELKDETLADIVADSKTGAVLASQEPSEESDALRNESTRSALKMPGRIATVQLLTGETIESVAFCSKDKARRICDGLGFVGIVLETDDGRISVVRESNIKMVTWKAV